MADLVRIADLHNVATLRLKAWMSEYVAGGTPVTLGGRELPTHVGAISTGPIRILCLGPGEWLMASSQHHPTIVRAEIAEADLGRQGLVLVDLTQALARFEVLGPAARALLSKGCGLDFHHRSFPVATCARTRLAPDRGGGGVRVRGRAVRDFRCAQPWAYLRSWLDDAAVEYSGS
jgi:sarcosine oxidase subunit gamma